MDSEFTNDPASEGLSTPLSGATPSGKQEIVYDLTAKTVTVPVGIHALETSLPFGVFIPNLSFVLLPSGFTVPGGSAQPALGSENSNFDVSGLVKFIETSVPVGLGMLKTAIKALESKKT